MKVVIIAAGYATRLYPLTLNTPKPLLPIGDSTILGLLLREVKNIPDITEYVIVSNHKFIEQFNAWVATQDWPCQVTVVDDGTETNETRLGAVRDLLLAVEQRDIKEDILVLAADNLIEFSLADFVAYAQGKHTSCIMYHEEPSIEKLQRTGVVTLDTDSRVLDLQEKPQVPNTHNAVPPFYYYVAQDLPLIRQCIEQGGATDAPGNLAQYIYRHSVLHAWHMNGGRVDIGNLETYKNVVRVAQNI